MAEAIEILEAPAVLEGLATRHAAVNATPDDVAALRAILERMRAGVEAGRGLSAYSSADIKRVAGYKSSEIAGILGYRGRDEIIHRDDLVVNESR